MSREGFDTLADWLAIGAVAVVVLLMLAGALL